MRVRCQRARASEAQGLTLNGEEHVEAVAEDETSEDDPDCLQQATGSLPQRKGKEVVTVRQKKNGQGGKRILESLCAVSSEWRHIRSLRQHFLLSRSLHSVLRSFLRDGLFCELPSEPVCS